MSYISSRVVKNQERNCSPIAGRNLPGLALVVLLFSLLLAACGDQGSDSIVLKLITWNNPATVQALNELDAAFHQKYPNIRVQPTIVSVDTYNAQLVPTRLRANDVDILSLEGGLANQIQPWTVGAPKPDWQQWVEAHQIMDLTGQPFLANYYPSAIKNASTYNGKVYSVPNGLVSYTGLFYNRDIFAHYHLDVPKTYNDFIHVCETLKANGVDAITTGGKEIWPLGLLTQAGIATYFPDQQALAKDLWTGSAKFTDPKFVEVIQRSQKFLSYMQNNFMGEDTAAALGQFAAGKVGMLLSGTWDAPTILNVNPSAHFGYFPAPLSDNAAENSHLYGKYADNWFIAGKSKHQDAALKWMSFMSDPINYAKFAKTNGIIPVESTSADIPMSQELKPYLPDFKLAWDQIVVDRANLGKYATGAVYHLEFLSPAGPITSAADLAQKTQADWDAAAPK